MFNKLFNILGFNSGKSLVGLCGLSDTVETMQKPQKKVKKELKISDLMRGDV